MRLVKISTNTLASPTTQVTFSSIPQSYTDLFVVIMCKHADTGSTLNNLHMYINNETTGYYYYNNYRYNDSTSTGVGTNTQSTNQSIMRIGNNTVIGSQRDSGANPWSYHRLYLPSYSSTDRYKTVQYRAGANYILTGFDRLGWSFGLLDGISAITSLKFENENNTYNFIAGSRFELYGVA